MADMYMNPETVVAQFNSCKGDRANTEDQWQDNADYLIPRKNDVTKESIPGERKGTSILDSTGINSAELLASSLHGMLTSPVAFFFGLTTGNLKIDNVDAVRLYLQECVRALHFIINNSNFQTEVHEYYIDLVTNGNGALFVEEDDEDVVRFQSRALKEIYVKENYKGRIDTAYRLYKADTRAIMDEFSKGTIPQAIKEEFEAGKSSKHEILHAIYPKNMVSESKPSKFNLISQYIFMKDKKNIQVGGFREFPLVYGRWSKISGEVYGRGPGEKALPEVKTINKMTETTIRGAQKVVDPPLQAPDDGFIMPLVTRPGGFNYYRAGSTDRIETIFNDSRIDFGFQMIDRKAAMIRESFYIDQLKLKEGPQMTATEVNERVEQALRFMAPMLGRQQSEFLAPLIGRVWKIAERRGMLPKAPAELGNNQIRVQYSSVMAASQRMSEMTNINRFLNALGPVAAIDPGAVDNVDTDASVRHIGRLTNVPAEMLRNEKDVKLRREERAKAQAEQQQAAVDNEEAKAASSVISAASKFQQKA